MDGWYKISAAVSDFHYLFLILKDISKLGGSGLLRVYNDSVYSLLSEVYSNYDWLPWKFEKSPRNMWDDVNIKIKFITWLEKQLNIKEKSDWYKVTIMVFNICVLFCLYKGFQGIWRSRNVNTFLTTSIVPYVSRL